MPDRQPAVVPDRREGEVVDRVAVEVPHRERPPARREALPRRARGEMVLRHGAEAIGPEERERTEHGGGRGPGRVPDQGPVIPVGRRDQERIAGGRRGHRHHVRQPRDLGIGQRGEGLRPGVVRPDRGPLPQRARDEEEAAVAPEDARHGVRVGLGVIRAEGLDVDRDLVRRGGAPVDDEQELGPRTADGGGRAERGGGDVAVAVEVAARGPGGEVGGRRPRVESLHRCALIRHVEGHRDEILLERELVPRRHVHLERLLDVGVDAIAIGPGHGERVAPVVPGDHRLLIGPRLVLDPDPLVGRRRRPGGVGGVLRSGDVGDARHDEARPEQEVAVQEEREDGRRPG